MALATLWLRSGCRGKAGETIVFNDACCPWPPIKSPEDDLQPINMVGNRTNFGIE
jgi:hypothetical protein